MSNQHGWEHANDIRTAKRIQRRALFLARLQSGQPRHKAIHELGLSVRQARRYLYEVKYVVGNPADQ